MSDHLNQSTPAAVHGADASPIAAVHAACVTHSPSVSAQPGVTVLTKRRRGMDMVDYILLAVRLTVGSIVVVQCLGCVDTSRPCACAGLKGEWLSSAANQSSSPPALAAGTTLAHG